MPTSSFDYKVNLSSYLPAPEMLYVAYSLCFSILTQTSSSPKACSVVDPLHRSIITSFDNTPSPTRVHLPSQIPPHHKIKTRGTMGFREGYLCDAQWYRLGMPWKSGISQTDTIKWAQQCEGTHWNKAQRVAELVRRDSAVHSWAAAMQKRKSFLKQEENEEGIFCETPCGTCETHNVCLEGMNGCKLLLQWYTQWD